MPKLTEKQKRFCEEYLVDLNATQSAIRAGYSIKTANRIASENLSKPDIQTYIRKLLDERSERTGVSGDKIIEELQKIAFAEDVVITGKEKLRALELLGKYFGLFIEKAQIETDNKLKITLEWEENENGAEENQ